MQGFVDLFCSFQRPGLFSFRPFSFSSFGSVSPELVLIISPISFRLGHENLDHASMGSNENDAEVQNVPVKGDSNIVEDAQAATAAEVTMDVRTALRLYPKAAAWSVFFSMGVIMTGFDPQVIGNLYGVPKFQEDFGYEFEGKMIISAAWQSGLRCGGDAPVAHTVRY